MSHRCKHIHQHREGPAIQHFRWQKTPMMSRSSRQWSPTWAHCSSPAAFSCLAHCYSFLKESNVINSFSLIIKWLVDEILRLPFSCYSVRSAPISAHKRGITGIWGKQGLGYISYAGVVVILVTGKEECAHLSCCLCRSFASITYIPFRTWLL